MYIFNSDGSTSASLNGDVTREAGFLREKSDTGIRQRRRGREVSHLREKVASRKGIAVRRVLSRRESEGRALPLGQLVGASTNSHP